MPAPTLRPDPGDSAAVQPHPGPDPAVPQEPAPLAHAIRSLLLPGDSVAAEITVLPIRESSCP